VSRLYAWSVFGLTFGLMLSDYVSRMVVGAVFPFLKAEWTLSDTQLGALVSVVALIVGLLAFPVALLADRWGRVKSITAMAGLWSLATVGCGLSASYGQMLVARGIVGVGEAGYGSAGGAILSHVFPPRQRSAVLGAFLSAGLFGSVLGVALGGVIATRFGWRWAFLGIGAAGLLLALLYPLVVRDYPTVALEEGSGPVGLRMRILEATREIFAARSAVFTYLGSGLQMLILGVINAWMPSFLMRSYQLAADQAAVQTALIVLVSGVGMVIGGWIVDRASVATARNKLRVPALYAAVTFVLLTIAFVLPAGTAQRVLIFAGVLLAGGHAGAAGAVVTEVIHPGLRATALATLTLANSLLGLAPGPLLVGALSDVFGLPAAMAVAPLASLAAAACFGLGSRHYERDRGRFT
jgi:MFS family permease